MSQDSKTNSICIHTKGLNQTHTYESTSDQISEIKSYIYIYAFDKVIFECEPEVMESITNEHTTMKLGQILES